MCTACAGFAGMAPVRSRMCRVILALNGATSESGDRLHAILIPSDGDLLRKATAFAEQIDRARPYALGGPWLVRPRDPLSLNRCDPLDPLDPRVPGTLRTLGSP